MSRSFEGRLAKIEAHQVAGTPCFVVLPADADEHGEEHLKRVEAESMCGREVRAGQQVVFIVTGVTR
jgi:hypothetical protein